jgi:hypothetical protein
MYVLENSAFFTVTERPSHSTLHPFALNSPPKADRTANTTPTAAIHVFIMDYPLRVILKKRIIPNIKIFRHAPIEGRVKKIHFSWNNSISMCYNGRTNEE